MEIGVCTSPEQLDRPPDGLTFIEGLVAETLCPLADESAFAARLVAAWEAALPIKAANQLFPGQIKTTGPQVDLKVVDAFFTTACRRAARMGVAVLVYGSGGSRQVPDGFDAARAADQIVAHLKRWGPIAADHGIVLTLEPLCRRLCNIVNSVDEAAELVRRADHPSVRVVADTFHMASDAETPDSIRRAGELIAHAHCAESGLRGPLGATGQDHRPYFRALKDIGYSGRLAIEAKWSDFPSQLPRAVAYLREQIDTA